MKFSPKPFLLLGLIACCIGTMLVGFQSHGKDAAPTGEKKKVLIIRGASTHGKDSHNNDEVGQLIKDKLEASQYADSFVVQTSFNYPKDLSLVENADLIIISSDGGGRHALGNKKDTTKHTKHLVVHHSALPLNPGSSPATVKSSESSASSSDLRWFQSTSIIFSRKVTLSKAAGRTTFR
ncbi:hypothetical protein OAK86_03855 [Akkermansiaceae bacterium]|nr:hypothetical protein [Akkermansiaceae bacterium]